jgi:hypothetical protein
MKIQVEVEIFGDSNYCHKIGHSEKYEGKENRCSYFYGGDCEQFRDKNGSMIKLEKAETGFDYPDAYRYQKCPQCKAAWQNAKGRKETAQEVADGLILRHKNGDPLYDAEKAGKLASMNGVY